MHFRGFNFLFQQMWAYAGAGTKEKFGEDVVEALFTDMQNIFNEKDSAAIGASCVSQLICFK